VINSNSTVRITGRTEVRYAKYCLRPKLIENVSRAKSVSCGEAHTVVLLNNGSIISWGDNSCGQLGIGISPAGFLRNLIEPKSIHPFISPTSSKVSKDNESVETKSAKLICVGSFHTIVIDSEGGVWTWGARGNSCLGHSIHDLPIAWKEKIPEIFPLVSKAKEVT
jgi:alpha-tubulin suppressor-like RCC1 family protein